MGSGELGEYGVEDTVRELRSASSSQDRTMRVSSASWSWGDLPEWGPAVGFERRAQPAHCMMESGSDGAGGDAEGVGDLVDRQVQVLVQHEHGAVVDRQPAEAALELVPIEDIIERVGNRRLSGRARLGGSVSRRGSGVPRRSMR